MDAKGRVGHGSSVGWQNRIGPQGKIPDTDRGVLTEQDFTSVVQPAEAVKGAPGMDLQMLRSKIVDECNGIIQTVRQNDTAVVAPQNLGGKCDPLLAHMLPITGNGLRNLPGNIRRVGDQKCRTVGAMFRFVQEVQRRNTPIRRLVTQDNRLAGPRWCSRVKPVDQKALGSHDPGAAGTHKFPATGHRVCPIGNSRHTLGTAALVDLLDPGDPCRNQSGRINRTIGAGRGDDDYLRDPRNPRRNGCHDDNTGK